MRKRIPAFPALLTLLLLVALSSWAQGPAVSFAGSLTTAAASLNCSLTYPCVAAVDAAGNLYVGETSSQSVMKIDTAGSRTTFASLSGAPTGIAVDQSGNVYLQDYTNNQLLRISPLQPASPTVIAYNLYHPRAVTVDGQGNVYFSNTPGGAGAGNPYIMTALAGAAIQCYGGQYSWPDACATVGNLPAGWGVAVDGAGNVFSAAYSGGVSELVFGATQSTPFPGLSVTYTGGIALDAVGNLYGAASTKINKISSGQETTIVSGLGYASNISADRSGNLYIMDSGANQLLRLTLSGAEFGVVPVGQSGSALLTFSFNATTTLGSITAFSNGATTAEFVVASGGTCAVSTTYNAGDSCTVELSFAPVAPGSRSGAVKLQDGSGNQLAQVLVSGTGTGPAVAFTPGTITTVAGTGVAGYSGDNWTAFSAQLNWPISVTVDGGGNLFITDFDNNRIRRVDATSGVITTVAGDGSPTCPTYTPQGLTGCFGGDGGPATSAQLDLPRNAVVDGVGNLYIADTGNSRIRKVTPDGTITTIAGGNNWRYNGNNIPASSAQVDPWDIAIDAAGNLYIADYGNYRIRKITAATGIITTVAGNGTSCALSGDDGLATSACIGAPMAVSVDAAGNIYIPLGSRIRKVDAATGIIDTVVGTGVMGYGGDGGLATDAQIGETQRVTVDGVGNLFIAERHLNRIRKVNAATGIISTIAGTGAGAYGGDDGPATSASMYVPSGLGLDAAGNLYIAEEANSRIRKINFSTLTLLFPDTDIGSMSAAQDVTVENVGNAPLDLSQISVTAGYNLQGPNTSCQTTGQTLSAGAGCVLGIVFAPQTEGGIEGSVDISNNALNNSSAIQSIGMFGHGLVSGASATSTTLTSSANPSSYGSTVTFTATVTSGGGTPTGFVTLMNGGTTTGAVGILDASGSTTIVVTDLPAGSYNLTAVYGGDAGFLASTSAVLAQTINKAATSISLMSSKPVVHLPDSLTLTAAVPNSIGGPPTGTVNFFAGTTALGAASLEWAPNNPRFAIATLTLQNPAGNGKFAITAVYSGDANYAGSTSAATNVYVFPGAPDFRLAADKTRVVLRRGQWAVVTITLKPINGYDGNVSFDCKSLLSNMNYSFTPPQLAGNLDGTEVSTTLTIKTAGPAVVAANRSRGSGALFAFWSLGLGALGLVLAGGVGMQRRRGPRRHLQALIGCGLLLLLLLAGCGFHASESASWTPTGTTTSTVTASATVGASGAAANPNQQLQIEITVLP